MYHWLMRKARYYEFKGMKWWDANERRFRDSLTGRYLAVANGADAATLGKHDIIKKAFLIRENRLKNDALGISRYQTISEIIDYLDEAARKEYHGREEVGSAGASTLDPSRL